MSPLYPYFRFATDWKVCLYPIDGGIRPVLWRAVIKWDGARHVIETFDGKKFRTHNLRKFNRKSLKENFKGDFEKNGQRLERAWFADKIKEIEQGFIYK